MKISKGFIVAVAAVLGVGGYYRGRLNEMNRIDNPANMTRNYGLEDITAWRERHHKPALPPSWNTNPPPPYRSNRFPHNPG